MGGGPVDAAAGMHANNANLPHATEYTLQGEKKIIAFRRASLPGCRMLCFCISGRSLTSGAPSLSFLSGVMRFLQTEWHRYERERNSWEIEKQEMKARIANLEGQARRADATQKALSRYVTILEKKIVNQKKMLKGAGATSEIEEESARREKDRALLIQEKLRCKHTIVFPLSSVRSWSPTESLDTDTIPPQRPASLAKTPMKTPPKKETTNHSAQTLKLS